MNKAVQNILMLACASWPLPSTAQSGPQSSDDIIVRGVIPHCKPLSNDPQDSLPLPEPGKYMTIVPEPASGSFKIVPPMKAGTPRVTAGPDVWLRQGSALADFNFRVPKDGTPLCIGSKSMHPRGQVQLMHSMDGKEFACTYLRFTLFVASRKAQGIIWLNGGDHTGGGDYNLFVKVNLPDKMSWTPIMLQVGPVDLRSHWVGYGVVLQKGDVWFVQPKLDIVSADQLSSYHRRDLEACKRGHYSGQWGQENEGHKL